MNVNGESKTSQYYLKSIEEAEQELNTSIHNGISHSLAEERLKIFGLNQLKEGKKRSVLSMFIDQFKDCLLYTSRCV